MLSRTEPNPSMATTQASFSLLPNFIFHQRSTCGKIKNDDQSIEMARTPKQADNKI